MRRDPTVFGIGEDVAEAGHPFKVLLGLAQEFGTKRIIDTPISEPGYAGGAKAFAESADLRQTMQKVGGARQAGRLLSQ
jgi:pyruvate/2-oxoglutarate/acetoin dehydrogenase E1 component